MTVKNYVLDINKTSLQHPSIVLRQDDYNIYTVNISVTENGVPVNLGSYTLNFLGITPAGAKIIDSENFITNAGDLALGKFSYRFPKEAAGSKGVYDVAYFRLKTTSGATSTIDLNLRVLGGIDLTADEVKDYITVDDTLRNTLVSEVFKKVDAKVDEHLATVKKGDKGDKGDKGEDGYMPVIGGRNYILNSSGMNASSSNIPVLSGGAGDSKSKIGIQADRIVMTNNQESGEFFYGLTKAWTDITKTPLIAGNTYTLSVRARGTSPQITLRLGYQNMNPTESVNYTQLDNTKWTRATLTFTIPVATTNIFMRINGGINNKYLGFAGNETIEFKEVMLEQSNVASDWTPAPEDADSTYFKNARRLPADARDFAIIASDTIKYQGIWYTDSSIIANGPTNNWSWCTIEVIGGFGNGSGIIRTAAFGPNQEYITTVNTGKISGWNKVAYDNNIVHKTGNETVAGDKTFTSNTTLATTTILAGNYGLRVTPSGFQKTTDGKTWVSANI